MPEHALRQSFYDRGYVVIKGLLSAPEVEFYIEELEKLSGIRRSDFKPQRPGLRSNGGPERKAWTLPDGVSKQKAFWPLLADSRLLTIVKILLGSDVRYLQHSDLHVGFSAIAWHRDCVNRSLGHGPDWDETMEPYRLVRVGIYLQSFEESRFKLGFIPGSNRLEKDRLPQHRKFSEAGLKWLSALSFVFPGFQMGAANAEWIATEPGDCLIFDPRMLHSGSAIIGPKYSIFFGYGLANRHFYRHQYYYRRLRRELGYENFAPELQERLKMANLYAEEAPFHLDNTRDAWVPSAAQTFITERLKKRPAVRETAK